ncbi:quinohemoprotein amine dehydrogenase subunit beta [Azohydromonas caseinilytica]|uniref:Quinohemoprotein amine dehydrogenase subunit beta n=1 Tax=Azohydromonas caseinilytica TaxID=2728836 RepID=A0A848FK71_9BURK|nr:quinohemoprotein amine dehydrogenase subunit beta [Azohydromonas caseinilytica]NML18729.1 quinohemoprotein amine dehydrogenase subunit beta [Azohydromonas caseinilytica]
MRNTQPTWHQAALQAGVAALLAALAGAAAAKDYIVTACRPGTLVVIDAQERRLVHAHPLPNSSRSHGPGAIAISPDGRVAYVLHNHWETVSGIEIDSGKEVFRAELTQGAVRGKSFNGIDISPDGKELAVYTVRNEILPGELRPLEPHIAVYDTASGLGAEPVRKLPAPRRVSNLLWAPGGKTLYAFGWEMLKLDPQTGAVQGSHPFRSWQRPHFGQADTLNFWLQREQSNVFVTPYFVPRTDRKPDSPDAVKAGLWTLDLATDQVRFKEFENASVVLFSSVVNPVRRDEVFTVFNQLTRTDLRTGKSERVDLDHSFYSVNMSTDGSEVYLGGAGGVVAFYDSRSMKKLGAVNMPGNADQSIASLRVVKR